MDIQDLDGRLPPDGQRALEDLLFQGARENLASCNKNIAMFQRRLDEVDEQLCEFKEEDTKVEGEAADLLRTHEFLFNSLQEVFHRDRVHFLGMLGALSGGGAANGGWDHLIDWPIVNRVSAARRPPESDAEREEIINGERDRERQRAECDAAIDAAIEALINKVRANATLPAPDSSMPRVLGLSRRPGRPPKYRWSDFAAEMTRYCLTGPITTQTAFEEHMGQWCDANWGEEPAVSMIRDWVAPTFKAIRPPCTAENAVQELSAKAL